MTIDLDRFRQTFFDEATERVAELESGLLRLESEPGDRELLDGIFRAAHSIKGSSGTFGFAGVTRLTHALEDLLDRMREGTLAPTPAMLKILLHATDVLGAQIAALRSGGPPPVDQEAVLGELAALQPPVPAEPAPATVAAPAPPRRPRRFRVRFEPHARFFASGSDPLLLLRDLEKACGAFEAVADLSRLPELASLDPEQCCLAWDLLVESDGGIEPIREVFAFVEDSCELVIAECAGEPPAANGRRSAAESTSLRVSTEKLDELINLVGELVIAQSMVHQVMTGFTPGELTRLQEAVTAMGRNTRELQERVMSVRMVPISAVFGRFPRLVHDIAAQCGKEITLDVSGEETELDKSVIEAIADPLTHLVRNAIDHGIETAVERQGAGKPAHGTIRLRAGHEGGSVVIEVVDDGRGLDTRRIREKAVALGLVRKDDVLTAEEIHSLIFRPGFSTADVVSDLSGRGVGMDVVKRSVEALNGAIGIVTQPGQGTRFRLKLPLTLAILDGLLLGVGRQTFVLPLIAIVESLRPAAQDVRRIVGKGEVVLVRGEALRLLRLHALFGIDAAQADPARGLVVIVENDGRRLGLLVDELLGQAQVVIKNLEASFRRVEGVMGATILGNGTVALILDVQGIARLERREARSTAIADPPAHRVETSLEAAGAG